MSNGNEQLAGNGDGASVATGIDPNEIDASGTSPVEPPARKRRKDAGQPRGSRTAAGTAKTEKTAQVDLSSLTGMFVGLHVMLASVSKTPELEMTMEEGANFTKAAQNVMRHYGVRTTQKTIDWIALMGVTAGIYAPRVVAMRMRKAAEAAERREHKSNGHAFGDQTIIPASDWAHNL